MGQHRHNPRAIQAAQPRSFRVEPRQPDVAFGFELQSVIEPNAKKLEELRSEEMRAKLAGEPVPVYRLGEFSDDDKDFVVYRVIIVRRSKTPGGLELQTPVATAVRRGELLRVPLAQLLAEEGESLDRFLRGPVVEG